MGQGSAQLQHQTSIVGNGSRKYLIKRMEVLSKSRPRDERRNAFKGRVAYVNAKGEELTFGYESQVSSRLDFSFQTFLDLCARHRMR